MFFQSIVKYSPFAPQITHDCEKALNRAEEDSPDDHGCHYIDWSAELPKVLDLKDIDKLLSSKSLFARKFDEQKSRELIIALENQLVRELYVQPVLHPPT